MYQTRLTDYLDRAAARWGDRTAVEDAQGGISYGELRQNARRLACRLGHPGRGEPVAVYLPKGIPCLTGMLAALYSGNLYAPMDTRAPMDYLRKVLETLGCNRIITDGAGQRRLSQAGIAAEIFTVEEALDGQADESFLMEAASQVLDCDPAFVLFTSGSTGVPKGVAIPHRRVIDYVSWAMDYFGCDEHTVIGNQAPFLFTVSTLDIYLCFAAGARLCLIPEHTLSAPPLLTRYLNEHRVSFIFWVPSVYRNVAQSGCFQQEKPAHLRICLFVGEPMPVRALNYWMCNLPKASFYHLYGATETDMTLCYPVTERPFTGEALPLGKARRNVRALLLDTDGRPVKPGQIGEICIQGPALACGYWGRREKTEAAFVRQENGHGRTYRTGDLGEWDGQGNLVFHGRRDHQFKHLGYRVEATGIEQIALNSGLLRDACVVYDKARQQIVLFYVAGGDRAQLLPQLQRYLLKSMPAYMLPTRLISMEELPQTSNGKRDRAALAKRAAAGTDELHKEDL